MYSEYIFITGFSLVLNCDDARLSVRLIRNIKFTNDDDGEEQQQQLFCSFVVGRLSYIAVVIVVCSLGRREADGQVESSRQAGRVINISEDVLQVVHNHQRCSSRMLVW